MTTIAQAAAEVLRKQNAGYDCDEDWLWSIDCGMVLTLHEIYTASSCSMDNMKPFSPGVRPPKSTRVRHSVMNALGNTAEGRRLFECKHAVSLYPGIVNGRSRIFVLRKEFRR